MGSSLCYGGSEKSRLASQVLSLALAIYCRNLNENIRQVGCLESQEMAANCARTLTGQGLTA